MSLAPESSDENNILHVFKAASRARNMTDGGCRKLFFVPPSPAENHFRIQVTLWCETVEHTIGSSERL